MVDHDQIQTIQFKLNGTDVFHKLHSLVIGNSRHFGILIRCRYPDIFFVRGGTEPLDIATGIMM